MRGVPDTAERGCVVSLGDTLFEAVDAIDADLREGFGTAWSGATFYGLTVTTRDALEHLRCLVDADALGAPLDRAHRSFRPLDLSDAAADTEADDGD